MTPAQFSRLGEKLYKGYGWQTRMADDLGLSDRTIRNYVSGASEIKTSLERWLLAEARRKRIKP